MDLSTKLASEIIIYSKYAKYLPEFNRRETWDGIIDRYQGMMEEKYPFLNRQINTACRYVRNKKVLPSMRMLQFAGPAILKNNSRGYNCSFMHASSIKFFRELMFLLLGGTGVGYSVQKIHIDQLPPIKRVLTPQKFLIGDSIEGWADAVGALVKAFLEGKPLPAFDYSDIRPKGTLLRTAGGRAPGPGPLQMCLWQIEATLAKKPSGSKLTSVEVSDICCYIAGAVLSGGIRRSAMICLFDIDDQEMLKYKQGSWWEKNKQRAQANISAVAVRGEVTREQFNSLWQATRDSKAGEPGIYWTHSRDWGANPCVEIALRNKQFCNLTTLNLSNTKDQADLNDRVSAASLLGTLQSGFFDFHYLDKEWAENCRKEPLLGVSITGIGDNKNYADFNFKEAAFCAVESNDRFSERMGLRRAARITCVKPEGTASMVLGSSSGVHGRHAPYYIRRFRFKRSEPIAVFFASHGGIRDLLVDDVSDPDGVILELPIKSPGASILRDESSLDLLQRTKFFQDNWVSPGHINGVNKHNVSCTISVRDNEWDTVRDWMWDNRSAYNGISVLPHSDHTYVQAPFEDITETKYEEMMKLVGQVDLSAITETKDLTTAREEAACSSGSCELTF